MSDQSRAQFEIEELRNEAIQLHRAGCVTFDELDELSANANRLLFANPMSKHACRLTDILNRRHAHRAVAKQNEELRARVAELEEAINGVVTQRADDLCWRDIYTELAKLVGIDFTPELICDQDKFLANCKRFDESLRSGGGYLAVHTEQKAGR